MLDRSWIGIIRRIPTEAHSILSVVMSSGIEITIQTVLRMEDDFIVFRGRLAGTTDVGRVFFIPYDQIGYLCIQKEVSEELFQSLFGDSKPGAAVAPAIVAAPAPAPAPANDRPEPPPPPPQELVTTPSPAKATERVAGKDALLERLRARAKAGGGSSKPPPKP